jgi:hypothetical protein
MNLENVQFPSTILQVVSYIVIIEKLKPISNIY